MNYHRFKSCEVDVFAGYCVTRYPDGASVRSTRFDDQVAYDYGYGENAGTRFSIEHELIHHFVAERLGEPYSLNQYLLAHGAQPTDQHKARDLEEAVVAGFTFFMNKDRLPEHNADSWTRTPEVFVAYAGTVFANHGASLVQAAMECRGLLNR